MQSFDTKVRQAVGRIDDGETVFSHLQELLSYNQCAVVIDLIVENTPEALEELRRRHRMHTLKGAWRGSNECHVASAGDWLLVWRVHGGVAFLQRTGTHDEIFR